jgi:hypothetical protein
MLRAPRGGNVQVSPNLGKFIRQKLQCDTALKP